MCNHHVIWKVKDVSHTQVYHCVMCVGFTIGYNKFPIGHGLSPSMHHDFKHITTIMPNLQTNNFKSIHAITTTGCVKLFHHFRTTNTRGIDFCNEKLHVELHTRDWLVHHNLYANLKCPTPNTWMRLALIFKCKHLYCPLQELQLDALCQLLSTMEVSKHQSKQQTRPIHMNSKHHENGNRHYLDSLIICTLIAMHFVSYLPRSGFRAISILLSHYRLNCQYHIEGAYMIIQ